MRGSPSNGQEQMTAAPADADPATPAPEVSVLVPAWRAERWLERAVRSALAQEGPSLEVIVIDDASPDGTAAVAARLAAEDPRVRLIRNPANLGPGASRNAGAKAARGRWLALLDADDAFAPGRLDRLVRLAEEEGLDAAADLPVFYDLAAGVRAPTQLPADGRLEILTPRAFLEASIPRAAALDYGLLQPIYRRESVAAGLWRFPEHVRHGEDFLAMLEALRAGVRFGVLHAPGYLYSTRLGETSGAYSPGSVTAVDYRAVARDAEALAARLAAGEIAAPGMDAAEAAALLARRAACCREHNARYGWNTLRKGAWRRHLVWLRQDPRNAALLLRTGLGRLARRLARAGRGTAR